MPLFIDALRAERAGSRAGKAKFQMDIGPIRNQVAVEKAKTSGLGSTATAKKQKQNTTQLEVTALTSYKKPMFGKH